MGVNVDFPIRTGFPDFLERNEFMDTPCVDGLFILSNSHDVMNFYFFFIFSGLSMFFSWPLEGKNF